MIPRNIKDLQANSRHLRPRLVDADTVIVESASDPESNHTVTIQFKPDGIVHARCTCPWAEHHGVACSHVMAALEYLASLKNRTLSFWTDPEQAHRQKRRVFYLEGENRQGIWITSRAG